MNPINKTYFPTPLKEYYEQHQQEDNEEHLTQLFTCDETSRTAFLDWTKAHKALAKEERLAIAKKIATNIFPLISCIPPTQTTVLCINNSSPISMETPLLSKESKPAKTIENFSKKNAITALTLYRLKLINKEQFKVLFNEKSLYTKFTPNKLFDILSHDSGNDIADPIFNEEIFDAFLPYLKSLPDADFVKQLSFASGTVKTPLFNRKILKNIAPLFTNKKAALAFNLLSYQGNDGNTVLHYRKTYELLGPILKLLDMDKLQKLHRIKNNEGLIPLNYTHILGKAAENLPDLSKRHLHALKKYFTTLDADGYTPLHYPDKLKMLYPVLELFDPETLDAILSIRTKSEKDKTTDKEGHTVRQLLYHYNIAFPLLNKILFHELKKVLDAEESKRILDAEERVDAEATAGGDGCWCRVM